jgi:hypothetical protein
VRWTPQAVAAVLTVAALTIGTTAVVLVAITRGEPLSTQAVGIVSVVWGALAGGVSAWLGGQTRDDPDPPADPPAAPSEDGDDE